MGSSLAAFQSKVGLFVYGYFYQAQAFWPLQRDTPSGEYLWEHLVIIGKPFEGCRYSDGGEAGLLNMARKTQPAWQHTPLNDLVN